MYLALPKYWSRSFQIFQMLRIIRQQWKSHLLISPATSLKNDQLLKFDLWVGWKWVGTKSANCHPGDIRLTPFIFQKTPANTPSLNNHNLSVILSSKNSVSWKVGNFIDDKLPPKLLFKVIIQMAGFHTAEYWKNMYSRMENEYNSCMWPCQEQ